ncbi:MAG: hypothetical protein RLZZ383_2720 [Pseudomonadota bacterium]
MPVATSDPSSDQDHSKVTAPPSGSTPTSPTRGDNETSVVTCVIGASSKRGVDGGWLANTRTACCVDSPEGSVTVVVTTCQPGVRPGRITAVAPSEPGVATARRPSRSDVQRTASVVACVSASPTTTKAGTWPPARTTSPSDGPTPVSHGGEPTSNTRRATQRAPSASSTCHVTTCKPGVSGTPTPINVPAASSGPSAKTPSRSLVHRPHKSGPASSGSVPYASSCCEAPAVQTSPSAGPIHPHEGDTFGGRTWTVADTALAPPTRSVTTAVMSCQPSESGTERRATPSSKRGAAAPKSPCGSLVHTTTSPSTPSSASSTTTSKPTGPSPKSASSAAGARHAIDGRALGATAKR